MALHKLLKFLHISGTVWLTVCAGFLLILALRQAGVSWWVVFSVSGFSGVAFLFLLSVYLFAVFRGVTRKQLFQEHPLTSSGFYLVFYDACPFLGTIAGLISAGAISASAPLELLSLAAEGSLVMTFLVWILGDPFLGLFETFLPASTAARRERLLIEKENRRQREENRRRLLEQIRSLEQNAQTEWTPSLLPLAEKLITAIQEGTPGERLRQQAVEIGAYAWQKGQTTCMQHLLGLINRLLQEKGLSPLPHLAFWWDGIGNWRKPDFKESFAQNPPFFFKQGGV